MRTITKLSLTIESAIDKISIIFSVYEGWSAMVAFPDIDLHITWGIDIDYEI